MTTLTEQQKQLIISLPATEHGRALFAWLSQKIEKLDHKAEHAGKICDDPLLEDFRTQMGIKIGLKQVLNKPEKLMKEQQKQRVGK